VLENQFKMIHQSVDHGRKIYEEMNRTDICVGLTMDLKDTDMSHKLKGNSVSG